MPSGNPASKTNPEDPAGGFVASTVRRRGRAVDKALRAVIRSDFSEPKAEKAVHQLRVATRRAAAALDSAAPLLPEKRYRPASKLIRSVRRAAGPVRDADVLIRWIKSARRELPAQRSGFDQLGRLLRAERVECIDSLPAELTKLRGKLGKRFEAVALRLERARGQNTTLTQVARSVLERHADEVLTAASADLGQVELLHALRIACKQLRYAIEVFSDFVGDESKRGLLKPLAQFQQQVGGFTDCSVRVEVISRQLASLKSAGAPRVRTEQDKKAAASLRAILRWQRSALRREHKAARAAWDLLLETGLFDELRRVIFPSSPSPPPAAAPRGRKQIGAPHSSDASRASRNGVSPRSRTRTGPKSRRRIAAIDIGTNSIRLIIGEADADGSYRVLDDEKEITRLGRGLHETGLLDPQTQEHSAVTIARMKSIAEGYWVGEIRVVATAACREAANAADFLALVRERAGLDVEVIPAEQEALLAYRSAANAFDLAGSPAAVVDLGGGSLEIVFSAGAGKGDPRGAGLGGGVIERVFSLPLGAVRLTEQFGGPSAAADDRYRDLTRFVDATLRKQVGKVPFVPVVVVGTGGTFTTLAGMLVHKELGPAAQGLFSGSVQGKEIRRSDLRHLLDYLRKLSIRDRARVPGLPADRADIIVAGLTVIDRLLASLGANSILVHEGGIRDGLLLTMVRSNSDDEGPAGRAANPLRGVMRFAKACGYEAAHAGHVARLSLQIFDQLAEQTGQLSRRPTGSFSPRDRVLLEAAAILHDVGYLVNYASHHKHSYHLIVHADLPGLTSREIHVVANVARYHRAAEPKSKHRNFASLSEDDQRRVLQLAGILRVADGLDRTHMQKVRELQLRVARDAAHFEVVAVEEPSVDVWGAARKARLFAKIFGALPHFEWKTAIGEPARPVSATADSERIS